jgi:hypothetical protein
MSNQMGFYCNIYLSLPTSVVKHIIGKQGAGFSRMSKKLKLDHMWYNCDTNAITLYGDEAILEEAKIQMCKHINVIAKKQDIPDTDSIYNTNPMAEEMTVISLRNVLKEDHVKHLIGVGGTNFKRISRNCNIYFMWYDSNEHIVKIWGTKFHTMKAIKALYDLVNRVNDIVEDFENEPSNKKQRIDN